MTSQAVKDAVVADAQAALSAALTAQAHAQALVVDGAPAAPGNVTATVNA